MKRQRILFYSHDSFGLGHFRRSLTIASYLTRHIDGLSVLMLTGLDSPAAFDAPPGVDFVKLPSIWKTGADQYRSRHLKVSFNRVRRMREQLILTLSRAFDPSLVVVDNVPRGVDGELLPTLRSLKKNRPSTRIALTLRDVLDTPEQIIEPWRRSGIPRLLARVYDEIWVAGCQSVFDPIALYALPEKVAERVRFCGYIARSASEPDLALVQRELHLDERRLVVVSCGGGGDGERLLRTYIGAALGLSGVLSAVFLGPDMPAETRRELKQTLLQYPEQFAVYDFRQDLPAFLQLAAASVSMGGYNTTCEILRTDTPALIVPRNAPRLEQTLRADAFAALGLVHTLPADHLDTTHLRDAVQALLRAPRDRPARLAASGIDLAGLTRITRRVRKHLGLRSSEAAE